jgi:zinc-finger binding domain of transposase IS66
MWDRPPIGEDVSETLDIVPRQWFVTEHVREKFSCRACEKNTQPPAPFHAIARACRAEPAGDDPDGQIRSTAVMSDFSMTDEACAIRTLGAHLCAL